MKNPRILKRKFTRSTSNLASRDSKDIIIAQTTSCFSCFYEYECSWWKAIYLNKLKEIIHFQGRNLWIKSYNVESFFLWSCWAFHAMLVHHLLHNKHSNKTSPHPQRAYLIQTGQKKISNIIDKKLHYRPYVIECREEA